jgi:electron-transferring-flavoprotein dehydrogenase
MSEAVERERLDVDILFVGAGAATLAAVIKLADLCKEQHVELPSILVIEKAPELGTHQLSGAMMDPKGMAELMPDFVAQGFPFHYQCTVDETWMMGPKRAFKSPLTPPPFMNHGNYAISLSDVVKWLGTKAEERGIEIYPGFPAARPIFEGRRVVGVQVQDRGVDKDGKHKGVFEAGPEIRAKCVVFGEGTRGSCTKVVIETLGLQGENPQAYETGIKEIWRIKPENHVPGRVVHTMGWPQDPATFGGGWIYDLKDHCISIGFVTGLDYDNPYTDPHDLMQRWKTHPRMKQLLEGGECIRYGAKTMPVGGYFSFPKLYGDGFLLVGDSAGTCNGERLKGVHLAIKSGLMAAETLLDAIRKDDYGEATLSAYKKRWDASWLAKEHYRARNFHASFKFAQKMPQWLGWLRQLPWLINGQALAMLTGGRGLVKMVHAHPDHEHMKKLAQLTPKERQKREKVAYDNKYTFDKVTAVALAGSRHEVDQPHHLHVADTNVCATRCATEYGNPCESFCPAAVYEMIPDDAKPGQKRLVIHHENCVHCKTCDVADPYAIITWTTPEGGDGPDYANM